MSTTINGSSPSITFTDGTTQSTAANITAPYTSNGVVYASSTTALATGSALTFNSSGVLNVSTTTGSISKTGAVTSLALATGDTYSLSTSLGVLGLDSGATALGIRMNYGGYYLPFSFNKYGVMSVGGATPSTSGAGITFPATQSASSDANTLDDYEEGTFTPDLVNNGGTSTWSVKVGRYTKVGAQINFWCYFDAGGAGSGGALLLSGLPFTGSGSGSTQSTIGTIITNLGSSSTSWYPAFQSASTSTSVIWSGASQVSGASINYCVVQGSYNAF